MVAKNIPSIEELATDEIRARDDARIDRAEAALAVYREALSWVRAPNVYKLLRQAEAHAAAFNELRESRWSAESGAESVRAYLAADESDAGSTLDHATEDQVFELVQLACAPVRIDPAGSPDVAAIELLLEMIRTAGNSK